MTLTATPDDGYRFLRWEGEASGSQNPLTITLTDHVFVTAIFEEIEVVQLHHPGCRVTDLGTLSGNRSDSGLFPRSDGCRDRINRGHAAIYRFRLPAQTTLTIGQDALGFYPLVYLIDASNTLHAEAEGRRRSSTAQISTTLAAGTYDLVVTTQDDDETGSFSLDITVGDAESVSEPAQQPVIDPTTGEGQRVQLFAHRILLPQTWQIGQPVNLTLPAVTERAGFYTYSIKYEWNHDQNWQPAGVRFDRNQRQFSGTPTFALDPNPALRRFTVFLRAEDRLRDGEWDELVFVVNLEAAQSGVVVPGTPPAPQSESQQPQEEQTGEVSPEESSPPAEQTVTSITGPRRAPVQQVEVKIKTRYHKNSGHDATVELRLIEIGQGTEEEVRHRMVSDGHVPVSQLIRSPGQWISLEECFVLSNWNCVSPMVRLREGKYEFAIDELTDAGRRVPAGASFNLKSFQRDGLLEKIKHPWEETESVQIHSIRNQRLHDLTAETASSALNKAIVQFELLVAFDTAEIVAARQNLKDMRSSLDDLKRGNDLIAMFARFTFEYQDELSLVLSVATGDLTGLAFELLKMAGEDLAREQIEEVEITELERAKEVANALKPVLDKVETFAVKLNRVEKYVDTWKGLRNHKLTSDDANIVRSAHNALLNMPPLDMVQDAIADIGELKKFVEFTRFSIDLLSAVDLSGRLGFLDPCDKYRGHEGFDCEGVKQQFKVGLAYRGASLSEQAARAAASLSLPSW